MEFEISLGPQSANIPIRKNEDATIRILILGDFSARSGLGFTRISDRNLVEIDIDNFNEVMSGIRPALQLNLGTDLTRDMVIGFKQLEDFHPERIYQDLEIFEENRRIRDQILDPMTFSQAVADFKKTSIPLQGESIKQPTRSEGRPDMEDDGSMFERLLGKRPARTVSDKHRPDIGKLIQDIVAADVSMVDTHQQRNYLASVDMATSIQMRRILHAPDFRALEAAWRSLYWLINNQPWDVTLETFILDVGKQALTEDLGESSEKIDDTGLYRLLVDYANNIVNKPWSLLIGNYTFDTSENDTTTLKALGTIASQTRAPFIAGADSRILSCESLVYTPDPRKWMPIDPAASRRWQALRSSPAAAWIGLALPRFLLRLPYGARNNPIEQFAFEELTEEAKSRALSLG